MTTVLNIRPICEELKKVAREEINEVESRLPEDVATLRSWIEKQPHLRAPTDDQLLVSYLRASKHSLERAKSKIDYCFTIMTMAPELFTNNRMTERNIAICRSGTHVHLPQPWGPGGPRLHLVNFSKLDASKFNLNEYFRYQTMCLEMFFQVMDDNCIISGCVEIFDFTNARLSSLLQLDPSIIRKLSIFTEKAAAVRLKGIHMINLPKEARALVNLCKTFMSEKMRNRIYAHASLEDLYKILPQKYLPVEYGGSNGSIPEILAETERLLLLHQDELNQNKNYGVDERLRPGKKMDKEAIFGLEGSFRKLDID